MPFAVGRNPTIRTLQYLKKSPFRLNNKIKVFSAHLVIDCDRSKGMWEFVEWHFPQIQYSNPDVHCIVLKNMTPTPFIRIFTDAAEEVLIDCDNKKRQEISKQVIQIFGKTKLEKEKETIAKEKTENPANFGYLCNHHCICQFPGQVPCSGIVPVPLHKRGKWFVENVLRK